MNGTWGTHGPNPLPKRTPMEELAAWGEPPPTDPVPDRMHYESPGPAPWATQAEKDLAVQHGWPRPGEKARLSTLGWVALILAAGSLLLGSIAIISLTDGGTTPMVAQHVTTTGTCEKRIVGAYGLVATVTATNGTGTDQSGQIWVQWPVTGETAQRFVKPTTLAPGEAVEFPVNQDIPADRWLRTGVCTFGWESTVKPRGMSPAAFSIDWGKPTTTSPSKRVIEVVDKIAPAAWRVSAAVTWLDRYTASDMRMVNRCSGKAYKCVTVKAGKVKGSPVGYSRGAVITVDTAKAKRSGWYGKDARRTWLLVHELGHQHALGHSAGRNVMNRYVSRYKMALTAGQRATLRKR